MSVDNPMGVASASAPAPSAPAPSQEIKSEQASSPEANTPASPAPAEQKAVDNIESKQASGEKLTKKEEKVLKEYKLKVYGKDKTVKFDPSNDEEVIRYLQKAEASDEKFKEATEVRKAAMEFIQELRKNPARVLRDPNINIDLKKFAEQIINDEITEMEKSPEQREREKLQKELEDLKKQAKDHEDALKKSQFENMQKEQELKLESDISAALDIGGLPKTPRTVKAMAEMMMIALQNDIDLSAKDIAPLIKNTNLSEFKEIVQSLSDDQLEDFLGKEVIGRLRKKNLAKAKSSIQTANSIKSTGNGVSAKQDNASPGKKMSIRDFLGV